MAFASARVSLGETEAVIMNRKLSRSDPFRKVFDRAADAMVLADDERRYVDANPAACSLLGLEREEIVGRKIDDFTAEETRAQLADSWSAFVASPNAGGEWVFTTQRGPRNVEFSAVANVLPGLHLSILRDVTAQKRGEIERQLFVDVVAAMQVGLHVYQLENDNDDPGEMRLVYANPATLLATGISPDTIIGRTLREVFPPFMETEIPAIYLEVARGGTARSLGDVTYGDDRVETSVFAARVFPLPADRVGVAFNDVTSERRSEAAAVAILESMSDALFTLDEDWTLIYLNPQTQALLRRAPEELLGRNYWDVFPEAAGLKFETEYRRALRDQVAVEFEEYYPPLQTWFSVSAYPMGSGLAIYFRDINERRNLELRLLQSQKLEALGRLAGGITHDFNNLLTVITGYASLAKAEVGDDSAYVARALDQIQGAVGSATDLTRKLLTFTRQQPLVTTVADVNDIVSAAFNLLQPLLADDITVHRLLNAERGYVRVEVAQVEQTIVNLVINARDAMPNGGNLVITTGCVELDSSSVAGLEPGSYVRITVTDDGSGMDEETRSQIFDPFYTTKPQGRGTGLGLSTSYGTISQSGGNISVESTPGKGSTFTIHLPRATEPFTTGDNERSS